MSTATAVHTRPEAIRPSNSHGCRIGRCRCPRAFSRCSLYTDYPERAADPTPRERYRRTYRFAGTTKEIPNWDSRDKIIAQSTPAAFVVQIVRVHNDGGHLVTIRRIGYRGVQTVACRGEKDARTTANQIHNMLRHGDWSI